VWHSPGVFRVSVTHPRGVEAPGKEAWGKEGRAAGEWRRGGCGDRAGEGEQGATTTTWVRASVGVAASSGRVMARVRDGAG